MRTLALIFSLILSAPVAFAKEAPVCERRLEASITPHQAKQIIGQALPREMVMRALNYIVSLQSTDLHWRAQQLGILFLAIEEFFGEGWSFERFKGPDGAIGFSGKQGHFVVLHRDGRVLKGVIVDSSIDGNRVWNGEALRMSEVQSDSDARVKTPQ